MDNLRILVEARRQMADAMMKTYTVWYRSHNRDKPAMRRTIEQEEVAMGLMSARIRDMLAEIDRKVSTEKLRKGYVPKPMMFKNEAFASTNDDAVAYTYNVGSSNEQLSKAAVDSLTSKVPSPLLFDGQGNLTPEAEKELAKHDKVLGEHMVDMKAVMHAMRRRLIPNALVRSAQVLEMLEGALKDVADSDENVKRMAKEEMNPSPFGTVRDDGQCDRQLCDVTVDGWQDKILNRLRYGFGETVPIEEMRDKLVDAIREAYPDELRIFKYLSAAMQEEFDKNPILKVYTEKDALLLIKRALKTVETNLRAEQCSE